MLSPIPIYPRFKRSRRSFLRLGGAALATGFSMTKTAIAQANAPVQTTQRSLRGIAFYQTRVDLSHPQTLVTIGLANNAPQANSAERTYGDEPFPQMVRRLQAAVVANGTFFNTAAAHREVMGNMVAGGRFLRYRAWERRGTTLSLRQNNQPEMITPNLEERSREWSQYWFSITCGPRLVTNGRVSVTAESVRAEGFTTAHLVNPQTPAARSAIGFSQDGKQLLMVTFIDTVSLQGAAEVMRDIGAYQAMNLDGGASVALASLGSVLYPAGRNLTNVIAVYDTTNAAPAALQDAWRQFQQGEFRPELP